MCIRDRVDGVGECVFERSRLVFVVGDQDPRLAVDDDLWNACLLYTSDAADERSSVDLGGRRIIKKKKRGDYQGARYYNKE